MKKSVVFIALLLGAEFSYAQKSGFAVGLNINQSQNSFGYGVNITSPMFLKSFAFRITANRAMFEGIAQNEDVYRQYPFKTLKFGLVSGSKMGESGFRVYGESGLITSFNNPETTTKSKSFGGYGLMGTEFKIYKASRLFFEVGGMGSGPSAKKLKGSPSVQNGLFFGFGTRFYL